MLDFVSDITGGSLIRQLSHTCLVCVSCITLNTISMPLTFFMCLASSQQHTLCFLKCLDLSQHHAVLALSHVPNLPSITLFLLSHVHCFVSTSRRSYFLCALLCLRVSRCSSSALYVPCFVWLSITMLSQVLHLSITPLMCLALSQHDITPLFSALPFPLYIFLSVDAGIRREICSRNLEVNCMV